MGFQSILLNLQVLQIMNVLIQNYLRVYWVLISVIDPDVENTVNYVLFLKIL